MDLASMLANMLLCGVFGLLGQFIRIIVGLKKMRDEATTANVTPEKLFQWNRIGLSLLIGFVAGMLAFLSFDKETAINSKQTIILLMSAGYAGTDFIEGLLIKKNKLTAG